MPIRSIKEPKYRGISELYRRSDGKVTGYYVTYRDLEGKPVKKRVEASTRDEALQRLREIRQEIDRQKKEQAMSSIPTKERPFPSEDLSEKREKVDERTEVREDSGTSIDQDAIRVSKVNKGQGIAVAMIFEIVAYEDLLILYGFEEAGTILESFRSLLVGEMERIVDEGLLERFGIREPQWSVDGFFGERTLVELRHDLPHRLVESLTERLLQRIASKSFDLGSGRAPIRMQSICGVAKAEAHAILSYAQKALSVARDERSDYIYYDPETVRNQARKIDEVYGMLHAAIEGEGVVPYFQGIYDAEDTSYPVKFESLMRLRDGEGAVISPGVFLESSREYRLYTRLMSQMIDRVFEVLERVDVELSLNLSYEDICDRELCQQLIRRIEESDAGERLTVEILESERIGDMEQVNEFIYELRRYGVKIAIDDFGSGFSNLENILGLDVDFVKLDGSLVKRISDSRYREMLRSVVSVCHDLGIETVAEFVSDETLMNELKKIGVDYLQGFYLHEPQSWESIDGEFGRKGGEDV